MARNDVTDSAFMYYHFVGRGHFSASVLANYFWISPSQKATFFSSMKNLPKCRKTKFQ
jgi:hypothetical protein